MDGAAHRRNLPHLRLEGAAYFVTFRLSDSIPESTLLRWKDEREIWLRANRIDPSQFDSQSHTLANETWLSIPATDRRAFEHRQQRQFLMELDKCHGCCLLEKPQANAIVANALEFSHGTRVWTGDFVVMPNHVHIIVQPFPGVLLEDWLESVKRFTSTGLGKDPSVQAEAKSMMNERDGHLWQAESFDRIVRDVDELVRTRRYIANNPAQLRTGTFALQRMAWLDEFAP